MKFSVIKLRKVNDMVEYGNDVLYLDLKVQLIQMYEMIKVYSIRSIQITHETVNVFTGTNKMAKHCIKIIS